MKIAILSRSEEIYSTRRLKEAAEQGGHHVEIIDYQRCYVDLTSHKPAIHYQGKKLPLFDAIIPRIGAKRTFYGTAIVRQFETIGTYSINPSIAIVRSRDKLRTHQLLAMKGVNMPATGFAHSPSDIDDLIKLVANPPLIIKLIEGTQGSGVVLAGTQKDAKHIAHALMGLNENIIIQEYIAESNNSDIRCFVVGDKVVASIKRQAEPGEFRANIHRGARAEPIKITKEEREIAVKAAKILGLRMAGIDLLRSNRGPLVLEINSSPGLEGIEKTTQKDIAGLIIKHIEKYAKPISLSPKSRYQG